MEFDLADDAGSGKDGGGLFSYFLELNGSVRQIVASVVGMGFDPFHLLLMGSTLVLLFMGMFLDGLSMLLIITPLLHPTLTSVGYDGIWLGVVIVVTAEIGLLMPPIGLNAFAFAGVVPEAPLAEIFKGLAPFIAANLVTLALIVQFPEIVTLLPRLAGLR